MSEEPINQHDEMVSEELNEIELLKQENEKLLNSWKRTAADFENYKKRKEQETGEILEFAKEMTVTKLIPSLQSLEQVLKFAPSDEKYKDWMTGLKVTINQLEKTMEELGVKKIVTVGSVFDHSLHEAVEEQEGEEPNKIVKEIQPGFTLNGRVIIPAKVVVGKVTNNSQ
ncbi:MAG TPA: nucleotide exchange factor GrpE [Verrucomicrobiae bacterium]|nr:nucleotide exchange factor GrpE [Verrucomicrobiae bacterium]